VNSSRKYWRSKFCLQRCKAAERGIPFQLTFGQWFGIWAASGHMHERGFRGHEYCMARINDAGPYASGNVRIITVFENRYEQKIARPSPESIAAFVARTRERVKTPEYRAQMSVIMCNSPERINKLLIFNIAKRCLTDAQIKQAIDIRLAGHTWASITKHFHLGYRQVLQHNIWRYLHDNDLLTNHIAQSIWDPEFNDRGIG
jgi:hypothetical protein